MATVSVAAQRADTPTSVVSSAKSADSSAVPSPSQPGTSGTKPDPSSSKDGPEQQEGKEAEGDHPVTQPTRRLVPLMVLLRLLNCEF